MSEHDIIKNSSAPRTRASLAADLRAMGLQPGMTLLVHSAMSKLGWVNGGPVTVIYALMDVLTTAGTLVMPAHSTGLTDPIDWQNPPVPPDWVEPVRATMPLFDPARTQTRMMGQIAELFRTWPGVRRSEHPHHSFAAWGQHADLVTANHDFANSMGETSPLARIYELDGLVLLMGVGHGNNSSFHLSEYRAGVRPSLPNNIPVRQENGRTIWQTFPDIDLDSDIFPTIGEDFERIGAVTIGRVGSAECRLFLQREGVDFAEKWLVNNQQSTANG